jgi:hypothetical protein
MNDVLNNSIPFELIILYIGCRIDLLQIVLENTAGM